MNFTYASVACVCVCFVRTSEECVLCSHPGDLLIYIYILFRHNEYSLGMREPTPGAI